MPTYNEELNNNNQEIKDLTTSINNLPVVKIPQEKIVEPSEVQQEIVPDDSTKTLSKVIVKPAPKGNDVSGVTATKDTVLSGSKFVDSSGNLIEGTMPKQEAKSLGINAGYIYNIPAGYHNGSGQIIGNSLASQTSATATAQEILAGKTAYVNGNKITGTIPSQPEQNLTLSPGSQKNLPAGFYNSPIKILTTPEPLIKGLYFKSEDGFTPQQRVKVQYSFMNGTQSVSSGFPSSSGATHTLNTPIPFSAFEQLKLKIETFAKAPRHNIIFGYSVETGVLNISMTLPPPA